MQSVNSNPNQAAQPLFKARPRGPRSRAVSQEAKARLFAWCRVIDAVAEQRDALDHRIWREDPEDTFLAADVQTWCELAAALADFLDARRAA